MWKVNGKQMEVVYVLCRWKQHSNKQIIIIIIINKNKQQ